MQIFLVVGFGGGLPKGFDVGGGERKGAAGEFGDVEGFEGIVVFGWFVLGEDKGLMRLAEAVYVAEVRLAVQAIVALAGKDKPAAV